MIANGKANGTATSTIDRLLELDARHFEFRQSIGGDDARATYSSGETSRMNPLPRGVHPLGADADSHYHSAWHYYLHVERGRNAVRNHGLVEQGINRLIANLRLDNFQLDVNSGDPLIDQAQKEDWAQWTGETQAGKSFCDYEGERSFSQMARQSFFSRVQDGDNLHLPLTSGQLQSWESHHIRTPWGYTFSQASDGTSGIVHGAEVRDGRTVAYWVTPFSLRYHQTLSRRGQARRYPVYDENGNKQVFYNGFKHRFFQRRGISRLSAPRDAMTGFEDLNYSNIKASLRRALISYLMEDSPNSKPQMPGSKGQPLPQSGDRYTQQLGLGLQSIVVEQSGEPAQVIAVPDGKTMNGWNANLPAQAFFEHSALLLTMLSVNLDIPLMFLLLDGALVNFHGGRMVYDQAKLRFRQLQRDEIKGLWAPTYEWRTRLRLTPGHPLYDPALANAQRREGVDVFNYTFRPQGWPYVKPAEDVAAEVAAESGNVKSQRAILAERGVDFEEHLREVIGDRASWYRLSLATARRIAEQNEDLDLDVVELAKELRFGSRMLSETQSAAARMVEQEREPREVQ